MKGGRGYGTVIERLIVIVVCVYVRASSKLKKRFSPPPCLYGSFSEQKKGKIIIFYAYLYESDQKVFSNLCRTPETITEAMHALDCMTFIELHNIITRHQ